MRFFEEKKNNFIKNIVCSKNQSLNVFIQNKSINNLNEKRNAWAANDCSNFSMLPINLDIQMEVICSKFKKKRTNEIVKIVISPQKSFIFHRKIIQKYKCDVESDFCEVVLLVMHLMIPYCLQNIATYLFGRIEHNLTFHFWSRWHFFAIPLWLFGVALFYHLQIV